MSTYQRPRPLSPKEIERFLQRLHPDPRVLERRAEIDSFRQALLERFGGELVALELD
jgi:hypothetical protein